jgi:putative FmdB family regulatory protein
VIVPTYQYACTSCGEQLEAVQKFTDEPLTECPACQGRLRKVFNSVGIVFKGSGFYRTDSRNGSTAASAAKATPDGAGSTSPSPASSSSDSSKPAAASNGAGASSKADGGSSNNSSNSSSTAAKAATS